MLYLKSKNLIVHELKIRVQLKEDIPVDRVMEAEAGFIDSMLAKDESWLRFHEENKSKLYSFSGLWPIEKNGVYKKGKCYVITIRSVDEGFVSYIGMCNHTDPKMETLEVSYKQISKKLIEKIYTLTPVVLKAEDGYWRKQKNLDDFERLLFENAIKKYNQFTGEKADEDFELYTDIFFLNRKPISSRYKNIHLIGDKIELRISDNPQAQELAYFITAVGLGENCSRGFGFCNYKWI